MTSYPPSLTISTPPTCSLPNLHSFFLSLGNKQAAEKKKIVQNKKESKKEERKDQSKGQRKHTHTHKERDRRTEKERNKGKSHKNTAKGIPHTQKKTQQAKDL
jgi:hypothetical protein